MAVSNHKHVCCITPDPQSQHDGSLVLVKHAPSRTAALDTFNQGAACPWRCASWHRSACHGCGSATVFPMQSGVDCRPCARAVRPALTAWPSGSRAAPRAARACAHAAPGGGPGDGPSGAPGAPKGGLFQPKSGSVQASKKELIPPIPSTWVSTPSVSGSWLTSQAIVGAMGAVVAALLQAFTEPVLNRVAVKRMTLAEAVREVRLIDILRWLGPIWFSWGETFVICFFGGEGAGGGGARGGRGGGGGAKKQGTPKRERHEMPWWFPKRGSSAPCWPRIS